MILNKAFAKKLYVAVLTAKKISKLAFSEDEFINWCHTLNHLASMEYDLEMIGAYDMNRYHVPKAFRDLVVPRKISYQPGTKWTDIRSNEYKVYDANLDKYDMGDANILYPLKFNEVSNAILGSQKKDPDGNVDKVTELNGEKAAEPFFERFAVNHGDDTMVYTRAESFIPVWVESTSNYMYDKHYNQLLEVGLDSWVEDAINVLRG